MINLPIHHLVSQLASENAAHGAVNRAGNSIRPVGPPINHADEIQRLREEMGR